MQPVIGIACPNTYLFQNSHEPYIYLSTSYINGIIRAGGTPLLLPLMDQPGIPYRAMLEAIDGLILAGGEDPAPHLYGEEPLPGLGEVEYERDLAEIELIHIARELNKPMLGICRGMQIMNVALGGTLVQDIPSQIPNALQHSQKGSKPYGSHTVKLSPGFLRNTLGQEEVLVNTFHHQSVKDPAPGLVVTGIAPDGVVEAFESEDGMMIGIQWHPERMWLKNDKMFTIAQAFVEMAAKLRGVRQ